VIITKEFVEAEIAALNAEMENAKTFLIKAQAAVDVHNMLLRKLETPEPVLDDKGNQQE